MTGPPRLTEADQRKDEFLATLAHELRNPLAPIRFALENLRDSSASGNGRLAPATSSSGRCDSWYGSSTTCSTCHASRRTRLVLRREPHDLARLMTTAVESIMPLATAATTR